MTEWGVVGVIVALVGLITGIAAPLIKLNTSITRLNTVLDNVEQRIEKDAKKNDQSHDRLWRKNEEQDATLNDHEQRLTVLETKNT